MEIGQQHAHLANATCYRCGARGHLANRCPRQFDIRAMTLEEIEQHLALARDTVEVLEKQQAAAEEAEEPQRDRAEDFGHASG